MDLERNLVQNLKSNLNLTPLSKKQVLLCGTKRKIISRENLITSETEQNSGIRNSKKTQLTSVPSLYTKNLLTIDNKTSDSLFKVSSFKSLLSGKKKEESPTKSTLLFSESLKVSRPTTANLYNDNLKITTALLAPKPNLYSGNLSNISSINLESPLLSQEKCVSQGITPTNICTSRKQNKTLSTKEKLKEEKHSRKRKKQSGKEIKEKVLRSDSNEPVYHLDFASDLNDPELKEIREKIRSEKDNIFVENKDESDIKRLEKEEANSKKTALINMVSVALINAPNIVDVNDKTRQELMRQVKDVADLDPEFVLKVVLYTRRVLNVRTVSTFMLAFAAYLPETRPYLKKYFKESIVLPSDWISVGEFYQTFFDGTISLGALPTALRKAMTEKFPDFDEYQLGKYNKDKGKTKTKKVTLEAESVEFLEKENLIKENMRGISIDEDEEYELKSLSLKQLIRKLHISEPSYYVMCLVGKKYPSSLEEFYRSRLPGTFDESKSGQRMRLKIPETWETQVSLKGNKASTWQDLIDHKRLPFMAMLRNLRNMIQAGLDGKYYEKIIHRLVDEKSVINSKQFPFRFLSAYDIIEELEKDLDRADYNGYVSASVRGRGGFRGGARGGGRGGGRFGAKKSKPKKINYDQGLLNRFKKALETSLKISVVHNISPIAGTTMILIDVDEVDSNQVLTKSTSAVQRTVLDMCLLLGMMCKFHCEDCELVLSLNRDSSDTYFTIGSLDGKNILDNVHKAKEMVTKLWQGEIGTDDLHSTFLYPSFSRKRKFDNFLMIGGRTQPEYLKTFMTLYRKEVNPECLAVRVALNSTQNMSKIDGSYDVMVNGFSEQILRYISERGNGRQLTTVENVDIAFNLSDIKVRSAVKARAVTPTVKVERPLLPWRTVRVFISSTFLDMHAERDLLTKYVFPELRCWCYNYCLNLYEVDLRWGITQKQSQSAKQLEICLREVMRCDLFIGILGERLGWIPENYKVDDQTGLEWLADMPAGCSMTELEMRGFLKRDPSSPGRALFFFRDSSALYYRDIPKKYSYHFWSEKSQDLDRLEKLKNDISTAKNVFVRPNYPAQYGGVVDGKPYITGLETFGHEVLKNLWIAIKKYFIKAKNVDEKMEIDEDGDKHFQFAKEISKKFVGRAVLLQKALEHINAGDVIKEDKNLLVISGQNGSGKTAYMAELVKRYQAQGKGKKDVCCYFPEAGAEYQSLTVMLKFIFSKLNNRYNLGFSVPDTYGELKVKFENLLKAVSKHIVHTQCCVFIDGLDQLDTTGRVSLTEWIPTKLPKGILLVVSCVDSKPCYRFLSSHKQTVATIKIGALEHNDRVNLVRKILAEHGKQLDESAFNNQMILLLSKRGAESPLYLKLACEELRMFGVYEKLNDFLRKLSHTTPQLTEFILQRIQLEYGADVVKNVFAILYFTRLGLTEDDLYESLNLLHNLQSSSLTDIARDYGSRCYFNKELIRKQIPRSYFMRMCREIKMFLHENSENGLINLVHKDITDIIERLYIKPSGLEFASIIHVVLASYLRKQADPNNDLKWQGGDVNAMAELPYHMAISNVLWDDLYTVLTSAYFIQSKIEGGMCMQLLEDLHLDLPITRRDWLDAKKKFLKRDGIKDITEFVSSKIHMLTRFPKMFLQMAMNTPDNSFMQQISQSIPPEHVSSVIQWNNKPVEFSNCMLTISNIQSAVLCVSLSRDDKMVACGTSSGVVYVYDKNTGKELHAFYGHSGAVTSCCYAGENKLCSASADGTIGVWNMKEGSRLFVLKKHKEAVTGCVATTSGNMAISVSLDNTAVLWTLSDGKEAGELAGFEHPFNCVALDKDEKHAALGGWKRDIIIWNILENQQMKSYKGHISSVRSLAYSPNGRYLASSSLDGEILLWSTQNRAKVGQLSCHSSPVQHLEFTSGGLQLVGACTDTSVKVWSGSLGCPDSMYRDNSDENNDQQMGKEYALSVCASNTYLAVGYNSGKVAVFDKTTGNQLICSWKAHSSSVRSVCFVNCSGTEVNLLTASDDHVAKRWDLSSRPGPSCVYAMHGHTDALTCVRAREAMILTSSKDSTVRVWKGLCMNDLDDDDDDGVDMVVERSTATEKQISSAEVLHGHTGIVTCCDLSPCETKAISSGFDKALYVWDLTTFTALCVVHNAHADGVTTCCWSDVGTYVITGSNDLTLKLWNTNVLVQNRNKQENLKPRVTFTGHTTAINDLKYKYGCVSSASADGTLKIWTHNGIEITSFKPHQQRINCCDIWAPVELDETSDLWSSFDPATKSVQQKVRAMKPKSMHDIVVYTASDDGEVVGYRPFKPNLIRELYDHSSEVTQVVCSSTSNELLSCGLDESIKLWSSSPTDLSEDEKTTHMGSVACLAVYEESLLATGGYDGCVHIYRDKICEKSINVSATHCVRAMAFVSPTLVLTGDGSGAVRVWDLRSDKSIANRQFKTPVLRILVKKESTARSLILVSTCEAVSLLTWESNNVLKLSGTQFYGNRLYDSLDFFKNWLEPGTNEESNNDDGGWGQPQDYYFDSTWRPFLSRDVTVDMAFVSEESGDFVLSSTQGMCCFCDLKTFTLSSGKKALLKQLNGERESSVHVVRVQHHDEYTYVFHGHTNGKVSLEVVFYDAETLRQNSDSTRYSSKQVHNSAVTGLLLFDDIVVTSSIDSTIKIWRRKGTDMEDMVQVGLFCCRSSVISLEGVRTNDGISLYAGDRIGNVEFLTLMLQ